MEEKINELMFKLIPLLGQMVAGREKTVKAYKNILQKIPRVVLVDDGCLKGSHSIQGLAWLFAEFEQEFMSVEEQDKKTLYFEFKKNNDQAEVSKGDELLLQGTWVKVLERILEEIKVAFSV